MLKSTTDLERGWFSSSGAASAVNPRWQSSSPEDDEHLLVCRVGGNLEEVSSVEQGLFVPGTGVTDAEGLDEVFPVLAEEVHPDRGVVGRPRNRAAVHAKRDFRLRVRLQALADLAGDERDQVIPEARLGTRLADDVSHVVAHDVLTFCSLELLVKTEEGPEV